MKKYVTDTSVVVERLVTKLWDEGKIKGLIMVPNAVVSELEHQANKGQEIGFSGLEEIQELRKKAKIEFIGSRPKIEQIKLAKSGEIDALIIELAVKENAALITADLVQSESAKAFGLEVIYFEPKHFKEKLEFEKYFDDITMSIHIKEDCRVSGKKGKPGEWKLDKISEEKLTKEKIQEIAKEIEEKSRIDPCGFIEISRRGSTIIQYKNYRIVIVRPPVSDGWEITIVRPLKKLNIKEYKITEELFNRLTEKSRGIVIAGEPGAGKCHGKNTPILMHDGSIKMVQDVKKGDLIMGPDSNPRTVLSTTKGYGKLYSIYPVKGEPYVVNENHILSLKLNDHYKEKTVNIPVKDFLNSSKHFRGRCKGYRTKIEFKEKEVPINPYFLGVWLGDGLSASPRVASADKEIIKFLKEYAQELGLVLKQHSHKDGVCQTYGISTGKRGGISTKNQLVNKMRELNLINNKHLPNIYKINSRKIRLQVLAGLLDSDGYLGHNTFEIISKNLKEDILYLARSLGFAAYSKKKIVKKDEYQRISISGNISLIPTKIKRKIGGERKQVKNVLRTGINIKCIGNGNYYGFELNKDGLYCLGDFTVTHNSTFAQALGEYYLGLGRIVKTVESPRDLQLPDDITQYSKNFASSEEMHDILFLSRPDNIIFDEMRDTPDFELFSDLRLGGSECIGVIHSSSPIDAVQRFISRMEVGIIPSVVDTILFIDKGNLGKILSLNMMVKVPTGMTESDLARPVVEVRDFITKKLEYEIYSYGEQTVVIPVEKQEKKRGVNVLAERTIKNEIMKICGDAKVEIIDSNRAEIYVPKEYIPGIIGKGGKRIEKIEEKLGISLGVNELEMERKNMDFKIQEDKKLISILTEPGFNVEVYVDGEFLFNAISSKKGIIKVHKQSNVGRELLNALNQKKNLEVRGC